MSYENIKIEKGLYTTGKSFTQALEALDPSENYKGTSLEGLDAFERQLKRFDIKVSGKDCDTVSKFFQTTDSAALFPEFVSRSIKLGMKVPVRETGDVKGSAPIAIVGPKGAIYLKEGCIVAMRHIHMSPKDAQAAGVMDGDIVSVKADNERGTIFNQVKIRVDDSFTLEMHIDTDEANAAQIKSGDTVRIVSC